MLKNPIKTESCILRTGVGNGGGGGGGKGGQIAPYFFDWGGGAIVCLCPPPPPTHTHTLLTPHLYFPLELYVYITLTNNYLVFFIYQLIILWTMSINWHRWLLVNNHISKYNSFILVLYRRYINYVYVCPPPPPPPPHTHTHTFWHLPTPLLRIPDRFSSPKVAYSLSTKIYNALS